MSEIVGKDKDRKVYGDGTYSVLKDDDLLDLFRKYIECTKESGFRINYKITKLEWNEMSDDEKKMWRSDTDRAAYNNRVKVSCALMVLQEIKIRGLIETDKVYEWINYLNTVGT